MPTTFMPASCRLTLLNGKWSAGPPSVHDPASDVPASRVIRLVFLLCVAIAGCAASRLTPPEQGAIITTSSPVLARFPDPLVVSIYPFQNQSHDPKVEWLRAAIPDTLVAAFAGSSVLVIQRARLEEILQEQAFQLSGRVGDTSMVRIGRVVGATVLITGSVRQQQGILRIDGQV